MDGIQYVVAQVQIQRHMTKPMAHGELNGKWYVQLKMALSMEALHVNQSKNEIKCGVWENVWFGKCVGGLT